MAQSGSRLFVVVRRDTSLFEELGRTVDFILQLIVLDLQGIDGQLIIDIVQFGQQLSFPDEIALFDKDVFQLARRLESESDVMRLFDDAGVDT